MKKILSTIAFILTLACVLASCNIQTGTPSETVTPSIEISEDGYWVINGEKTDVKAQGDSASATNENPLGLAFFPKDDDTYIVEIGNAIYLSKIEIPATYNGKAVTEVRNFSSETLKEIVIPDSVTSIGSHAFYECYSLTSVTIPNSVTSIGKCAFRGCSSLKSASIGHGVTKIDCEAFYDCSALKSVTIGDSVTTIGDFAFTNCSSLTNVSMGDGITNIGERSFYGCSKLTDIIIPNSVTSIGRNAFSACYDLTDIIFENASGWHRVDENDNDKTVSNDIVADSWIMATWLGSSVYSYENNYWYRTE